MKRPSNIQRHVRSLIENPPARTVSLVDLPRSKKKDLEVTSVALPVEMLRYLNGVADHFHCSRSAAVRTLIDYARTCLDEIAAEAQVPEPESEEPEPSES